MNDIDNGIRELQDRVKIRRDNAIVALSRAGIEVQLGWHPPGVTDYMAALRAQDVAWGICPAAAKACESLARVTGDFVQIMACESGRVEAHAWAAWDFERECKRRILGLLEAALMNDEARGE